MKFSIKISSVNVTKFVGNCGFAFFVQCVIFSLLPRHLEHILKTSSQNECLLGICEFYSNLQSVNNIVRQLTKMFYNIKGKDFKSPLPPKLMLQKQGKRKKSKTAHVLTTSNIDEKGEGIYPSYQAQN